MSLFTHARLENLTHCARERGEWLVETPRRHIAAHYLVCLAFRWRSLCKGYDGLEGTEFVTRTESNADLPSHQVDVILLMVRLLQ
jgi:hypothetical protein